MKVKTKLLDSIQKSLERLYQIRKLIRDDKMNELSDEIKEFYGSCFDFNYPISVILNGVTYKFNSENDAILLAAAFDQKIVSFNFVYPFSIIYLLNNQNITVSDYYTFGSVLSNCD